MSAPASSPLLPSSGETGKLGVMHLKRYWSRTRAERENTLKEKFPDEWNTDLTLLNALGLGLEQTIQYLYTEAPSFEEFEEWVLAVNGGSIPAEKIEVFNRLVAGERMPAKTESEPPVLNREDLEFWEENGYVIIREAVMREDCDRAIAALCDFMNIRREDPQTWYRHHPARQGIMVQLFQHPALEKNRQSVRIRRAYEQLWERTDLWVSTDRVSFNPPETARWKFPGPDLHWDVSLDLPIPFGLQGLLYLSDTRENQGAFTLVPGFHRKIEPWLKSLPPGVDPRDQDLKSLGAKPVAANAGDFIIWHQALPHGSGPNASDVPRMVQYINYLPLKREVSFSWK